MSLSLVAYTFSGSEEESSENDDVEPEGKCNLKDTVSLPFSNRATPELTSSLIDSKEEDDDVKANCFDLFSKNNHNEPNISNSNDDLDFSKFEKCEGESRQSIKNVNNFSTLPPPKNKPSLFLEECDLEDEVRNKSFLNLPPVKKKESHVKITLPALPDPDSDDEEPKKKKIKPLSGSSGLFASLPEPKNMTTKEANRSLIPHTLNKKTPSLMPVSASKSLKKKQEVNPNPEIQSLSVYDGDEDEDEETPSADFFSLSSSIKTAPITIPNSSTIRVGHLSNDLDDNAFNWTTLNPEPMDYPLHFNKKPTSNISEDYSKQETQYYSDDYNKAYNYVENVMDDQSHSDEVVEYLPDKEFQRLRGKMHCGKEEINIIDVNADDQISDSQSYLTKSMSEEKEYRSSRKKGELPTVQQRRKHQITYLAFQAKERELELKNQWSQNRLTRKQTQSKYGF